MPVNPSLRPIDQVHLAVADAPFPVEMAGPPTLTPAAAQAPSANTAAVATLTGLAGSSWQVFSVRWSYSATPTAGSLTIAWDTNEEVYFIAAAGPGSFALNKIFPVGETVTFALAAGGSGVSGTLYLDAETEDAF